MKIACLVLLLIGLMSCSGGGQSVAGAGGGGDIQEIYLSDGTRCVVLIGYYKGAISCDWQGPKGK